MKRYETKGMNLDKRDKVRIIRPVAKAVKIAASTRLTPEVMRRLENLGRVDRRSSSDLIAICVEEHLPYLEAEIEAAKRAKENLKHAELVTSTQLNEPASAKPKKKVA